MANEDLLFNKGIRLIDKPNTREIKSLIFQGITKVKAWPSWMKRERERKGLTAMVEAGPTETIAEHLSRTRFDELPDEAVQATKAHILHTLGTIIAGSGAPGIEQLLAAVNQWGTKKESTVLVHGRKLPAPSAALINASMAHSRELDINEARKRI